MNIVRIKRKPIRPTRVADLVWFDLYIDNSEERETVLLARSDEDALRKGEKQYPHAAAILVVNRSTGNETALFRAQG